MIGPAVIKTVATLREEVRGWRRQGERVALAPTMGGLHEGHLALVRRGGELAPRVVVSIFVNPIQFNRADDFQRYPRDLKGDLEKLTPLAVEAVYAPEALEMYPAGFASSIAVRDLAAGLCGPHRPGHFEGVATVVAKLLLQAEPDFALFGEKDWQQLQIVRRMVRDLDIPVVIEGVATVREPDGLAMASRNVFLSTDERKIASALPRTLFALADELAPGGLAAPALGRGVESLTRAGFAKVDYLDLVEADTLKPAPRVAGACRIAAAAWLGATRLIDNVPVGPEASRRA
ncbi:MAG TPA: pantoate--beta-alanine ligase [Alphaproteobacteria bacterium]|nr:pantoate--beta-alanine ligase [Alphaproteobacteria bacterium]